MSTPDAPQPVSPYGGAESSSGTLSPSSYGSTSPSYGSALPPQEGRGARPRPAGLALVAFWAGLATAIIGYVFTLALPFLIGRDLTAYEATAVLQTILSVIVALVATITGSIALVRRLPGTGFAAAGTALGAATLVGVVISLIQSVMYRFV